MQVTLTPDGATVDAHDLGPMLGIAPADVPAKMRAGEITSQSEQGVDKDEGRTRLTFWYQDLRIRLICGADGTVLKTTRITSAR